MSNHEVSLIVVFNHRYDENIEKLKKLYADRFKDIFYLVPFYDGDKNNVIPVYERPRCFQGFFAQAFRKFFDNKYSHYVFIADDLILNQSINSENILKELNLKNGSGYIKSLTALPDVPMGWTPLLPVMIAINRHFDIEYRKQLPGVEMALDLFLKNNLEMGLSDLRPPISTLYCLARAPIHYLLSTLRKKSKLGSLWPMPYPLAMGYSDLVIVPSSGIKNFCHFCGMFAIMDIFVEVAIPTALILSCERIITETETVWEGTEIWNQDGIKRTEETCHFDLKTLYEKFKKNQLYLHPVKLSKWSV